MRKIAREIKPGIYRVYRKFEVKEIISISMIGLVLLYTAGQIIRALI